jgi:hypothetical protein
MWFNSQTIRVPFASVTGTTSYLTIAPRDHGMNRAIAASRLFRTVTTIRALALRVTLGMVWLR